MNSILISASPKIPAGRDKVLEGKAKKYEQMKAAAYDEQVRPVDLFGDTMTPEQHIPTYERSGKQGGFNSEVHV